MEDKIFTAIEAHPFFLKKIHEFFETDSDLEPFYLSLLNIDKQKIIKFNIKDNLELKTYFSKYLYTINELLFSFNAVLLKKYIAKKSNEKLKDNSWEVIFDKGNKKNKITYLLSELFLNDNDNHYYLDLIHRFYVYENLFRHQLSHGWIDIFPHIFDIKCKLNIKIEPIFLDKGNNVKDFFFDMDNLSLDKIRQKLKKDYYFASSNSDKIFVFEEVEPRIVAALDEKNNIFINELIKSIFIDYTYMHEIRIKEIESFISSGEKEKSESEFGSEFDFWHIYYKEKAQEHNIEEINFSLNKLIEDIYCIILRI